MFGMKRGSLGFANLIGLAPRAKKAEGEDEHPARKDDESDEDFAKRCDSYAEEHEDDEEAKRKDGESDSDYAKRMEADEPDGDEDDEGDEPEGDDNPDKDKDDEDAKKAEKKAEARGHKAEKARCAAIFASPEAANNIQLAAHLAFNTSLSATKAIDALKTASAGPQRLHHRMAAAPQPRIGSGAESDPRSADAIAQSWERAAAPFMPKK